MQTKEEKKYNRIPRGERQVLTTEQQDKMRPHLEERAAISTEKKKLYMASLEMEMRDLKNRTALWDFINQELNLDPTVSHEFDSTDQSITPSGSRADFSPKDK